MAYVVLKPSYYNLGKKKTASIQRSHQKTTDEKRPQSDCTLLYVHKCYFKYEDFCKILFSEKCETKKEQKCMKYYDNSKF